MKQKLTWPSQDTQDTIETFFGLLVASLFIGALLYYVTVSLPKAKVKDNQTTVNNCKKNHGQVEYVSATDTYNCLYEK